MILVCPLCQTRYLVAANLFAHGARQVRCAKCKHGWQAEPPREMDVVAPPPPPEPPPETVTPLPEGSNLPVSQPEEEDHWLPPMLRYGLRIAIAVFVAFFILWLVLDRQSIAKRWPRTEGVYETLGLHIYYPGDGLEFDAVRSELKFDGGITKLNLQGSITNRSTKNQMVPPVIAQAIGPDGGVLQSWQIDPPKATLAPQESAAFSSSINAPRGTVVNLNLHFVEPKTDD